MYTGPNLINDNLVFGYDTGYGIASSHISTRFAPGQPTTNLYTNSSFTNGETGWSYGSWHQSAVTHTAVTVDGPYGEPITADKIYVGVSSTASHFHQANGGKYVQGTTYTTSAWVKGFGVFKITSHWGGTQSFTLTGDWQHVSMTVTAGANSGHFIYFMAEFLTVGSSFYITRCQTQASQTLTPYVNSGSSQGVRSSTASLIDLKKEKLLDVGSISYDSTAQPEFDGTNDYINLGNYAALKLGFNFSLEFVVKPEQDKWMYFFHKGYGSNNALAWGRHSSGDNWFFSTYINGGYQNSYMGTATLNQYCHLVATYDGANLRLYENGVLKATVGTTHQMMDTNTSAGIGGPGRYWNGKIPVTKIYSKVLTTEEIVGNFNAYKNRFNI